MFSLFEVICYFIGFTTAVATLFVTESNPPLLEIIKDCRRHVLMYVAI